MHRCNKVIIISISIFLFLVLVCITGCIIFAHWADETNAENRNPGVYYIEEIDRTYQYELKMFGTLPNATTPISFYVYTDNANLSFSEVSKVLTSSQSTSNYDFYISEDPIETVN